MKNVISILIITIFLSCKDKPTVIQPVNTQEIPQLSNQSTNSNNVTGETQSSAHQIIAKEVKHTEKYTYILAQENDQEFWVAVPRQEIKQNEMYLYQDPLLKTNFYSQEFNKNFDKIYLVSSIIAATQHPGSVSNEAETGNPINQNAQADPNAIALKDLFSSKDKYAGKSITVSGKIVKANLNIMGRNWYHIQDNTKADGKNLDLTITSNAQVNVGDVVNFTGIIAVQKDFGSGYKYNIIMEQANLK
ncbi:MAG: SH3-like domain-containing protein [Saprospiraceae bacterium]|nr:SH3-like domain-containing protein [Saprospiraceae bacterium]